MAMPARRVEREITMEPRINGLEAHMEHVRSDLGELKIDVRRLDTKINDVRQELGQKLDAVLNCMGTANETQTAFMVKTTERSAQSEPAVSRIACGGC